MYVDESLLNKALFYQGDILLDFNFPTVFLINNLYSVTEKRKNVILLSQTCDLQIGREGNDRIIICPLDSENQLRMSYFNEGIPESSIEGRINGLRGNKKNGLFYLPKNDLFENSYANFARMTSVEIRSLYKLQPNLRLEDSMRHFLVDRLHAFLCRAYDPTRP